MKTMKFARAFLHVEPTKGAESDDQSSSVSNHAILESTVKVTIQKIKQLPSLSVVESQRYFLILHHRIRDDLSSFQPINPSILFLV